VRAWCRERGAAQGATLTLGEVWALSQAWYGNRLSPDYHGRTREQVRAIFEGLGLRGAFWEVSLASH